MKTKEKIGLALFAIPIVISILVCLVGCSHNTGSVTLGTRINLGFDPQSATANISYADGLNLFDVSRENSSWELEIDATSGVSLNDGSIKGVKRIKRDLGPQITGYLVDLAHKDPEMAKEYVKAMKFYWQYRANVPEEKKDVTPAEKAPETPIQDVKQQDAVKTTVLDPPAK